MSHFTRVRTRMVERAHLLAALRDLGHEPQEGEVAARGFAGARAAVEVKIAVRGGDIGFRRGAGGYEVVADWWGIRGVKQKEFIAQLTQRYAYHAARAKLQEQGFTLVTEEKQPDGRIHLVLRRMA
jgi:hypothetical protein